jgi:hypothetical protein
MSGDQQIQIAGVENSLEAKSNSTAPPASAGVSGPARSTLLRRIAHVLGLDRAIAYTVLARLWSMSAGLVTLVLIARFLTPVEQGYYYTFSSLVALQVFFELGFAFVVLQMASHERANLHIEEDGTIVGDATSHERLASILQTSVRWYSVMAVVMWVVLLPLGLRFFRTAHPGDSVTGWQIPWVIMATTASINLLIDPIFSFLEGCGLIPQVARMRLMQAVCGSTLSWAVMISHHGLFSPPMILVGQVLCGTIWLFHRRKLVLNLLRHPATNRVSWRNEIWPFQWKIAITWLSGYLVFQIFNPVLFAYQGPVAAGRMGMSLSITSALGVVAIAWMNTKASPFGTLIARREYGALDKIFFRTLKQSTALLAVGCAVVFTALLGAAHWLPRLASRVLTPWAFGILLISAVSNHVVFSEAIYMRAHKQEPLLVPGTICAFLIGCASFLLAKYTSVNAVAVGYFVGNGVLGVSVATLVFLKKRRDWHIERCMLPSL